MLRGAVFDFDGVIVDSHPVHMRAWKKFLASVGKTVSEEQLHFVLDGRKRDDILRHFMGELDADQIVEYGLRKEQCFREEAAHVRTAEGLLDFLEDLKFEQTGSRHRQLRKQKSDSLSPRWVRLEKVFSSGRHRR